MDIAHEGKCNVQGDWLYNQYALQAYTLFCCQNLGGGLKDKPTKGADPYHTAYGLSGCSFAQHKADYNTLHAKTEDAHNFRTQFDGNYSQRNQEGDFEETEHDKTSMLGGIIDNKLRRMHPIHNARYDFVEKAKAYYRNLKQ